MSFILMEMKMGMESPANMDTEIETPIPGYGFYRYAAVRIKVMRKFNRY